MEHQSWAERFQWCQKRYFKRYEQELEEAGYPITHWLTNTSMSEFLEWQCKEGDFNRNFPFPERMAAATQSFLIHFVEHRFREEFLWPVGECLSLAEIAMAGALYLVGAETLVDGECHLTKPRFPQVGVPENREVLWITPQATIGNHTVDFLLTYCGAEFEFRSKPPVPFQTEMVVECDGHDFREKTKEQVAKPNKRNRALQDLGFKVFHFSGREIWNDPFGCAEQAITALCKEKERQVKTARRGSGK